MGVIDFEFVDADINTSCIEKVWNANVKNVAGALFDLEFELPIEFGIAASAQGSSALSDTDLYNVDTDISYGFSGRTFGNIGSITVKYEQNYLNPQLLQWVVLPPKYHLIHEQLGNMFAI